MQGALTLFDRIFEYLDMPIDIKDAPNPSHLKPDEIRGEVTFENVSFTYKRDDIPVLSGLSESENTDGQEKKASYLTPREPVALSEGIVPRTTLNRSLLRFILDN